MDDPMTTKMIALYAILKQKLRTVPSATKNYEAALQAFQEADITFVRF
jgi:hypothetical protein